MTVIEPRLRTSFFVRMAILVGIPTFFGWVILVISRVWTPMVLFAGVAPGALTVAIILWSWLRGVRRLDDEGVTRRDGRRFPWSDLRTAQDVRMLLPGGVQGPLNNIDLHFRDGVVKVFPLTFKNIAEVMDFIARKRAAATAPKPAVATVPAPPPLAPEPAVTPVERPTPAPLPQVPGKCPTCGPIGDYAWAQQKGGHEKDDTYLPGAAYQLTTVREIDPNARPTPSLKQCPDCKTYFLYTTEYEFLISGSEDTETISRLSAEEARKYLA